MSTKNKMKPYYINVRIISPHVKGAAIWNGMKNYRSLSTMWSIICSGKEEPVDVQEIAKIAGCSYGFFQKVFSYMNGISFAEYVRSRKMTLAGYDLKSTDMKVVDISYKYGYDSPTSFTKAFHQFHGISPMEARRDQSELRILPKMQISVKTAIFLEAGTKGSIPSGWKAYPHITGE